MQASIQNRIAISRRHVGVVVLSCFTFATVNASLFAQEKSETSIVAGHATVHIVFVTPNENASPRLQGLSPQAVVGNIVLPIQSINPISISIDGEFVGHAMTGFAGIKPVYVLPHGKHKFEFSCEGFRTSKSELTVIGTGSKQYLIVKLEPNNAVSPEKATSVLPESNNPE
jgi:hypothetical protein